MSQELQFEHFTSAELPLDKIRPNPWNPNTQDDETFNRLAKEIQDVGFIDPIQVVSVVDEDGNEFYQIVGGEHRYRVAEVLGYETIPCSVLTGEQWQEEDLRKFVTLRLNVIKGDIDAEKFVGLYEDLAERYEDDALQDLFAIGDQLWEDLTKDIRSTLEETGVSKEQLKKFDEAADELKTVDDLSMVLNDIFSNHGDTLDRNFMYFSFGGKKHLYVQVEKATFNKVQALMDKVQIEKADADEAFNQLLEGWKDRIELTPNVVEPEEDEDAEDEPEEEEAAE